MIIIGIRQIALEAPLVSITLTDGNITKRQAARLEVRVQSSTNKIYNVLDVRLKDSTQQPEFGSANVPAIGPIVVTLAYAIMSDSNGLTPHPQAYPVQNGKDIISLLISRPLPLTSVPQVNLFRSDQQHG